MSALGELRAGTAGREFTAQLQRTIRAVAVARNFPPPEGYYRWDAEAVLFTASELMSDAQTPRRLTDLAVHCATDDALRARLQGTVRNFLADVGRRTPIGKLVVRINDVMRTEPAFVLVAGRWAKADGPQAAGRDDPDALSRAVAGQPVVVPAWGHDARREGPVADRDTIVALCGALLDAAGGSLTPRALARAIGSRVGIGQAPLSLDVDAFDGPPGGAGSLADGPRSGPASDGPMSGGPRSDGTANDGLRLQRAAEVLGELGDRERLTVAYPELTVRQLAPVLGVGASQCHVIRSRAAEIIRLELVDDDDAENVALLVMELARHLTDRLERAGRMDRADQLNRADGVDTAAGFAVVTAR